MFSSKPEIDPSIILEEMNLFEYLTIGNHVQYDCLPGICPAAVVLHISLQARISVYQAHVCFCVCKRKGSSCRLLHKSSQKNTFLSRQDPKKQSPRPNLENKRKQHLISRHAQPEVVPSNTTGFEIGKSPPSPATLFPVSTNPHLCL